MKYKNISEIEKQTAKDSHGENITVEISDGTRYVNTSGLSIPTILRNGRIFFDEKGIQNGNTMFDLGILFS